MDDGNDDGQAVPPDPAATLQATPADVPAPAPDPAPVDSVPAESDRSVADGTAQPSLTDEHYDWIHQMCGKDARGNGRATDGGSAPLNDSESGGMTGPKQDGSSRSAPNQAIDPAVSAPDQTVNPDVSNPNQSVDPAASNSDPNIGAGATSAGDLGVSAANNVDAAPADSAPVVTIEFNAFIPGSLGSKFSSFKHPKDLKNQPAFEAALGGVSGTWLEEPGSFAGPSSGPWLFSTDDRSFGGGSHRVGSTGTVETASIGAMKSKGSSFKHTTSGSSHGRWVHTGIFTSSGETGSMEGPVFKDSSVSGSQTYADPSADTSTLTVEASGSYPFAMIAPSIDYKLALTFSRDPSGNVMVSGEVTTNKFPFYELLINGTRAWSFTSSDKGPTISNLSSSVTSKLAPMRL